MNGQLAEVAGMSNPALTNFLKKNVIGWDFGIQGYEWNKGYTANITGKHNNLVLKMIH
jgi:hypothetical protein